TGWLASAGVAGLAIGFAAKDTLANFIAGVVILMDAPYKVGDVIIIDDVTRGEVSDIGMRSTRLLTVDNVEVTVPNAVIGNAKIVNESSGPTLQMRVRANVGVAYGSDIDQVRAVLAEAARGLPHVGPDEEPVVRFTGFGDSSLDFLVLVLADHPRWRPAVSDELNTRIYKALAAAGIVIPFPQRDLWVKEWPEAGAAPPAPPASAAPPESPAPPAPPESPESPGSPVPLV
ncbi:MAG: mechanosensitive ion channel family protein, partial [Candidatus Krumholzibacteriia bacterium]